MPTQRLSIKNRRVTAGEGVRTVALPLQASDTELLVTVTLDDPTADPPTPADFVLHVEALRGDAYVPVSTFAFYQAAEMVALVPVYARTLRLAYRAGQTHTVDLLAVVP